VLCLIKSGRLKSRLQTPFREAAVSQEQLASAGNSQTVIKFNDFAEFGIGRSGGAVLPVISYYLTAIASY